MVGERCFYCAEKEKFYCQVPSVPGVSAKRWIVSLDGQKPIPNNEETVDGCSTRIEKETRLAELRQAGIVPDWARIEYIATILEKAR